MTDIVNEVTEGSAATTPPRRRAYALLVAAGIFLSRIAGLVRQRVFAHYFGNSDAAGAFTAAAKIPNLLQNMVGEGVLSASFIPVYARLLAEKKQDIAGRVAGAVGAILLVGVSIAVAIGVLATPLLIDLIAPGFEGQVRLLTIAIVRILFPATGILVLFAWGLGILNSHRQFFLPYVAPVLWSAAMIATMIFFGHRVSQNRLAVLLAWGSVAGAVLQFGIEIPFIYRYNREIRFALSTTFEPVREVFRSMAPVFVSRGVVQLSSYIDLWIASLLGTLAVSGLGYAQTLYLLPISLFGMSVAAAELPEMASTVGTAQEIFDTLRKRLEAGLRQIAFFVVPTIVAFLLIGRLLVAALFQTGEFDDNDTLFVWYILIGSTFGLLAATLGRLYNSAFYAMKDTKTPLKFAVIRVVTTAALGMLFAFALRPFIVRLIELAGLPMPILPQGEQQLGAIGLAISSAMAGWIEFLLLRRAMTRRVGWFRIGMAFHARVWGGALVAGVAAFAADRYLTGFVREMMRSYPAWSSPVAAVVVAGIFGFVYFAITAALGLAESHAVMRRILRR